MSESRDKKSQRERGRGCRSFWGEGAFPFPPFGSLLSPSAPCAAPRCPSRRILAAPNGGFSHWCFACSLQITCNCVTSMLNTFGVEAARATIVQVTASWIFPTAFAFTLSFTRLPSLALRPHPIHTADAPQFSVLLARERIATSSRDLSFVQTPCLQRVKPLSRESASESAACGFMAHVAGRRQHAKLLALL